MPSPHPGPTPGIFVVEDSRTQGFALKSVLQKAGFKVSLAYDGESALVALAASSEVPAMVITDVEMPGMDGYELCGEIKKLPGFGQVPIVLLTTLSNTENILKGLSASADYYLTKPYVPGNLVERVKGLLSEPVRAAVDDDSGPIALRYGNTEYSVTANRRRMLNLLLCTYENAMQQNCELLRMQAQLEERNADLRDQGAKLEQANLKLEALASRDGLTGLMNHRTFRDRLEKEYRKAVLENGRLSLIMMDVDHFKSFNDRFGHPAGDEVLKMVAQSILVESRTTDLAARYGGEEFALLLPETEAVQGAAVAERIRVEVAGNALRESTVTISAGVATLNESVDSPATLLNLADRALYRSKAAGRNCVTCGN